MLSVEYTSKNPTREIVVSEQVIFDHHQCRCVMNFLVERRWTDCINKRYSLCETTYNYKDFNGGYICVLTMRVQNCVCVDGTSTKLWMPKMHTLTHLPATYTFSYKQSRTLNFITVVGEQYFTRNKKYQNITRTNCRSLAVDLWVNRHEKNTSTLN